MTLLYAVYTDYTIIWFSVTKCAKVAFAPHEEQFTS